MNCIEGGGYMKWHSIISSFFSSISSGGYYNTIIGGMSNRISARQYQNLILGGRCNCIFSSAVSNNNNNNNCTNAILFGIGNKMSQQFSDRHNCETLIIGGKFNQMGFEDGQPITTQGFSYAPGRNKNSQIALGFYNCLSNCSYNSNIIASRISRLTNSQNSQIISSCGALVDSSCNSVILGSLGVHSTSVCLTTTATNSNTTVLTFSSTTGISLGMEVHGLNIPDGATVSNLTATSVTIGRVTRNTGVPPSTPITFITRSNCQVIQTSNNSMILGGFTNTISTSNCASISGFGNRMYDSTCSSIMGGFNSCICTSCNSAIIGSRSSRICNNSLCSMIVGGCGHTIFCNSCNSSIIGGNSNTLQSSSNDSVIIGGQGLSFSSVCNRVIVPTVILASASTSRPHINFVSGASVSSPQSGDMWFDGSALWIRIGSTTCRIA